MWQLFHWPSWLCTGLHIPYNSMKQGGSKGRSLSLKLHPTFPAADGITAERPSRVRLDMPSPGSKEWQASYTFSTSCVSTRNTSSSYPMCLFGSHIPLNSPNKVTPGPMENTLHTRQSGGRWLRVVAQLSCSICKYRASACLSMYICVHINTCMENQRRNKECLGNSLAQLTTL